MKLRSLRALAAALLALTLAACAPQGAKASLLPVAAVSAAPENPGPSETDLPEQALSWQARRTPLSRALTAACFDGQTVCGVTGDGTAQSVVLLDGQTGEVLAEAPLPDGQQVQSLASDGQGGVYLAAGDGDGQRLYRFRDGALSALDLALPGMEENASRIRRVLCGPDGTLYLWCQVSVRVSEAFQDPGEGLDGESPEDIWVELDRLYALSPLLELRQTLQPRQSLAEAPSVMDVVLTEDGPVLFLETYSETGARHWWQTAGGAELSDPVAWDFDAPLYGEVEQILPWENGYLICAGGALYKLDAFSGGVDKLLDLSSYGIWTAQTLFLGVNGQNILAVDTPAGSDRSEATVLFLGQDDRTVLTLGALAPSQELRQAVARFNRCCGARIEILDYSQNAPDADAARQSLLLALSTGSGPDLICMDGLNMGLLAERGLLTDLYPLLDGDETLRRDSLVSSVRQAYEVGGGLYELFPAFRLHALWGGQSLIGEKTQVDLDGLRALLQSRGRDLSAVFGFAADEPVLTALCRFALGGLIDYDTASCDFTGPEFTQILEFAKTWQTGAGANGYPAGVKNGDILLTVGMIQSVGDYLLQCAIYNEPVSFLGFGGGSGTAVSSAGSPVAIAYSCADLPAAWAFLKDYLQNSAVQHLGFPVLQDAFDQALTDALTPKTETDLQTGQTYTVPSAFYRTQQDDIWVYEATQEQTDALRRAIEAADGRWESDLQILQIITEEAAPYLAGQKSLEETAKVIQGRVQIYLQEQIG